MDKRFCSLLITAGFTSLVGLACESSGDSMVSATQKSSKTSSASASSSPGNSTGSSSASVQPEGNGPDLNAHPSGKAGSGGDGSRAAVGDIKEDQVGENPDSGDETADNISALMSSMGGNQSAPASTKTLSLTQSTASELLEGSWKSGRSAEQDSLLIALQMGLSGDVAKVESSDLDGDSKELALKLAVQVKSDRDQQSASPIVSEATRLVGELEDPQEITMRVSTSTISVEGDFSEDQKGGGQWKASYRVTNASGNTATVAADREQGSESVEILFINDNQIWVPRPGGTQGTFYVRKQ